MVSYYGERQDEPRRSSIRVHRGADDKHDTFVSVHRNQAGSETALDIIQSVRGGVRLSNTVLAVGDSTYRVWNV